MICKKSSTRPIQEIQSVAAKHKLKVEIEWVEEFPSTINDIECVDLIRACAKESYLSITEISQPFRWSEDFGHFTHKFRGAMFGIGAGIGHPELHSPDYDFPDEIIVTGTKMFYSIITKILN